MMPPKTRVDADATDVVSTREGYDRWSEIYDEEDNPLIRLEEPVMAELLGDPAGLDIVDIGCGTGRWSIRLAQAGASVTAFDFSAGMLAQARAKPGADGVRFVEHDLSKPIPLPDAGFDCVLCCLVLDHVVDCDFLFREMARLCRRDGRIVISSMHPAMMLLGVQARFKDPATGRDTRPKSAPNLISTYVMAAQRAGLDLEHFSEHAIDEALAAASERAAKYLGWPMLLAMKLRLR